MNLRLPSLAWLAVAFALLVVPSSASGQVDEERLASQLEALAEGPFAEHAGEQIARGRELLGLAVEAREGGDEQQAGAIRSVLSVQLRLVRAVLEVARAEREADDADQRLADARERRRLLRERVERLLERAASLRRQGGAAR